jgi:hypothetical protein
MLRHLFPGLLAAAVALSVPTAAHAQAAPAHPWVVDFGIGWDKSISGNINSGAIGSINGQAVVILKNTYEDVYGTGLHIRFGGGYMLNDLSMLKLTFTYQQLSADLTRMGDIGVSNLYGQYSDYKTFGMDFGYRHYVPIHNTIRAYGEATLGVVFVSRINVVLAAPSINYITNATDFYDATGSLALAGNAGVAFGLTPQLDAFAQFGIRYTSGLSQVDQLVGTGLGTINDNSSRYSVPFTMGVMYRF